MEHELERIEVVVGEATETGARGHDTIEHARVYETIGEDEVALLRQAAEDGRIGREAGVHHEAVCIALPGGEGLLELLVDLGVTGDERSAATYHRRHSYPRPRGRVRVQRVAARWLTFSITTALPTRPDANDGARLGSTGRPSCRPVTSLRSPSKRKCATRSAWAASGASSRAVSLAGTQFFGELTAQHGLCGFGATPAADYVKRLQEIVARR